MAPRRVPVLICGGGTVGLTAAACLAHHGVRPLLVERHAGLSIHPRATGLGPRASELLRELGLIDQVQSAAADLARSSGKIAVDTLSTADLSRAERAGPPRDDLVELLDRFSPAGASFGPCSQDRLDPMLFDAAVRRDATVRFGLELVSVANLESGVTANLVDVSTGRRSSIEADYLIAADGSASRTRAALDISTSGPGALGPCLVNILFRADLTELVRGHEFALCEIHNPRAPGLLVAINNRDRWLFHTRFDPDQGLSPHACRELIRTAIGLPELDVEVLSALPWQAAASLADTFRRGRVFLVGDAAHVVPPVGGFGLNTGMADAHNLAWKLALVLAGRAHPVLLESYERERRPTAQFTLDQALLRLRHPALHWDLARASERQEVGMANPLVVALGYPYVDGAIVSPRCALPSLERLELDLDGSPGTRVPHLWLERDGQRVSTLDLVASRFSVLAGADGSDWCLAACVVSRRTGIELAAYRIGPHGDAIDPAGGWAAAAGLDSAGALLVRPDGVIAWRSRMRASDPERVLDEVLSGLLF